MIRKEDSLLLLRVAAASTPARPRFCGLGNRPGGGDRVGAARVS